MTGEVVAPHEVLADDLRNQLVDAMFEAYMAKGAIEADAITAHVAGFETSTHTVIFKEKKGDTYVYEAEESLNWNTTVECRMPGGEWIWKRLLNDKDVADDDNLGGTVFTVFDAPAARASIEQLVASWLDPWVHDSPSPNEFTNQITSIAKVAQQLYVGDIPNQNGDLTQPTDADHDLWNAMTQFGISADSEALSIDLFQQAYATDIWKTVGGQQALVYFAGTAITAEAAAWNSSYRSLRALVTAARDDFTAFARSDDGEDDGGTLTAVATVAGLLGATAGVAFPPFGVAMGVVSSGIGAYQLFNPADVAVPDRSLTLTGDTWEEKVTSFTDNVKNINAELKDAEQAIADACISVVKKVATNPDTYSLTRGWNPHPAKNRQGPGDDIDGMLGRQVDLVVPKLKKVAGACEAISHHQLGLAGILTGNDHAGNASALLENEWHRGYLPEVGIIGMGYDGPFDEFKSLIDLAVDLLVEDGRTSHRVAEWFTDTLLGFEATDQEREREMDRLARHFDQHRDPSIRDPEGADPRASVFAGNDPAHP